MTVLVTGGTRGIGLAAATELARQGREVLLTGRDTAAMQAAAQEIHAAAGGRARVEGLRLDLADLADVRRFAAEVRARGAALDGLVLNAGVNSPRPATTRDGFELTFGVNHLGHYLLAHLLLGALARPARVVVVASGVHDPDTLDGRFAPPSTGTAAELADPVTAPTRGQVRYSSSKLANVMTAYELSRRLHEAGISSPAAPVTVNAFDPGAVPGTGLIRDWPAPARWGVRGLGLLRRLPLNVHDVGTAGRALADLITDPALAGVSGRYLGVRGVKASSRDSHDQRRAVDLFLDSAGLTGLRPQESPLLPDPVLEVPAPGVRVRGESRAERQPDWRRHDNGR